VAAYECRRLRVGSRVLPSSWPYGCHSARDSASANGPMGSFPSARNERGILTFGNGSWGMKIENEDLDRERLSQRQLAAILGTSRRTLLNWQEAHRDTKRPMPRNADGSYHLDAVTIAHSS
jgi:hypothetical protein